jgi:hypothetical protein
MEQSQKFELSASFAGYCLLGSVWPKYLITDQSLVGYKVLTAKGSDNEARYVQGRCNGNCWLGAA